MKRFLVLIWCVFLLMGIATSPSYALQITISNQALKGGDYSWDLARADLNSNFTELWADKHGGVTIGTANGLSLATQVLSLAAATNSVPGAMTTAFVINLESLITLSGVAADSTDYGTFTGSTIPDNSTNKESLQSLETAIEAFTGPAWGTIIGTLSSQTDLQSALNAKENSLGNPTVNGYVLSSTIAGIRSWIDVSGGTAIWGTITGALSSQTDLQSALNDKQDTTANLDTVSVPTAWRLIYSSGSAVMTELAFGVSGTVLTSNGAAFAPTFVAPTVYQAASSVLDTYAGIDPAANVQSLLGAATYAAMRTQLDLEAGTDFYSITAADSAFQATTTNLDTVSAPTNYRLFYSNGTATMIELAFGVSGTVLTSNGAAVAPTFEVTGNASTVTNGVYTTDNLSVLSATTSAQLAGVLSDETGTGLSVYGTSPVLVTPNIGTPSAATLTNATGLPIATGLTTTSWRVFYGNATGVLVELALGVDGTYLMSNGATAAPTFETPAGSGDVVGPASAVDGRIATFDSTTGKLLKDSGATIDSNGLKLASTSNPAVVFQDADSPGTDKEAGKLTSQYIGGADGAENSDLYVYSMQAGSEVLMLQFDESDDQWEFKKPTTLPAGDIDFTELSAGAKFQSLAVADLNDTTTPSVLTPAETTNKVISNYKATGADHVFTMDAAHAAGNIIFVIGDEFQIDIKPYTGELFYLNGTAMAVNESIQNTADTLGEQIVGYSANINGSLVWMFESKYTNFVEETP